MDIKRLCFSLAEINGTSGDERDIAAYAKSLLNKYFSDVKTDVLGNVIGTNDGKGKHILLVAHMDQVGLIVRGIDDKGFILFDKVGGIDVRILTGAEVTVHGKKDLFGVICSTPPHLLTDEDKSKGVDISKIAIDVGYSKQKAEELISIGDRITVNYCQSELLNECICSSAFDDRASMAAVISALDKVKGKLNNIKLTVQFSVQEEVGLIGAKTGAFSAMPDEAIVVDVGFGNDPYTDKSLTIELGKGPSIGISPTLDSSFTKELVEVCKEANIPYQHDVMNGRTGTDADSINITGQGVRTALLSVPLRYMHTANEIINCNDIEHTAKLICAYLLKKEAEYNA